MLAVCVPAPVTRSPGSASGTCFAGPHSPWSPPFAPPTPRRIAPLCSPASQLLWRGPTSRVRASSATAPHLPDAGRQRRRRSGQTRDLPASDAIPMSDLSWLNPTPHAIAVYASRPLSPVAAQHSLPSGRYSLLGPGFHRLDRTSLRLAHSLDHLVGAGEQGLR